MLMSQEYMYLGLIVLICFMIYYYNNEHFKPQPVAPCQTACKNIGPQCITGQLSRNKLPTNTNNNCSKWWENPSDNKATCLCGVASVNTGNKDNNINTIKINKEGTQVLASPF